VPTVELRLGQKCPSPRVGAIARSGEGLPHLAQCGPAETQAVPNSRDADLTGGAFGFTAIAGILAGLVGPAEAVGFGAGGALALMLLAGRSKDVHNALYPARLELARHRRSEKEADILVVKLPPGAATRRNASRRSARAASSVLRVTDGVAVVPSTRAYQICAVLEADARARAAVEHRLRTVCGDQVHLGWASAPDDGVTLESLITAAVDRIPERGRVHRSPARQRLGVGGLVPRTLGPDRTPIRAMRKAR
jgi:hypothetical protein